MFLARRRRGLVSVKIVGVVVLVAAALGVGFGVGHYVHRGDSEKPTAIADAQEVVAAYNTDGSGQEFHIVGWHEIVSGLWRFRVKENGRSNYGCVQIHLRQFWHGQGTDFHGVGVMKCP